MRVAADRDHALDVIGAPVRGELEHDDVAARDAAASLLDEDVIADEQGRHHRARRDLERLDEPLLDRDAALRGPRSMSIATSQARPACAGRRPARTRCRRARQPRRATPSRRKRPRTAWADRTRAADDHQRPERPGRPRSSRRSDAAGPGCRSPRRRAGYERIESDDGAERDGLRGRAGRSRRPCRPPRGRAPRWAACMGWAARARSPGVSRTGFEQRRERWGLAKRQRDRVGGLVDEHAEAVGVAGAVIARGDRERRLAAVGHLEDGGAAGERRRGRRRSRDRPRRRPGPRTPAPWRRRGRREAVALPGRHRDLVALRFVSRRARSSVRDLGPSRDQPDLRARARERLDRAGRRAARARHHDDAAGARRRRDRRARRAARRRRCFRRGCRRRARTAACSPRPTRAPRARGCRRGRTRPPCAGS